MQITGLTTYHGLVAGSVDESGINRKIFSTDPNGTDEALEPSPAWEVAEFLIIALDRSGARVEGAVMALGCVPAGKGYTILQQPQHLSTILIRQKLSDEKNKYIVGRGYPRPLYIYSTNKNISTMSNFS